MYIPLDNLYNYIEGLFFKPVCMYLFYPHGSRDILTLQGNRDWPRHNSNVYPQVVCNDQEPLNYEFYQALPDSIADNLRKKNQRVPGDTNLRLAMHVNIHDNIILLHSEKNSVDLTLYQNDGYIDVYYWCHAVIAKDWYRFAKHDKRLCCNKSPTKDFLIYCRDWSGTREYRIKLQELLYKNNLVETSITGIMKVNSNNNNIENATFKNKDFCPENTNFFYNLPDNEVSSHSSADYCPEDFNNTHISVVLETIFDESKIHLTEKILRPIACGHPFILAAGPGSLEYLRSYGFKTFAPWIDESYDHETDSGCRLEKIVSAMNKFSALPSATKQHVAKQLAVIADYNKKWFFSSEFTNTINQELQTNIDRALEKIGQTRAINFRSREKRNGDKNLRVESRNIIAHCLNSLRKLNPPGK